MTRAVGSTPPRRRYQNNTVERLRQEGKLPPELARIYEPATNTPAELQESPAVAPSAYSLGGQELYTRLVARFGLGEDPRKREALYRRIVRLCSERPTMLAFVFEAADKAGQASAPDRYFTAAIVRMLRGGWEVCPL